MTCSYSQSHADPAPEPTSENCRTSETALPDVGLRDELLGFRVQVLGFGVEVFGLSVEILGFRVLGFRFSGLVFRY